MGWDTGYTIMEHTVITLYDSDILTKELLDKVMEPFKGTDCDSGGSRDLLSKDGLTVEQIICKTMEPEQYEDVITNPKYYEEDLEYYKDEPELLKDSSVLWKINEKASTLFNSIWCDKWKMW